MRIKTDLETGRLEHLGFFGPFVEKRCRPFLPFDTEARGLRLTGGRWPPGRKRAVGILRPMKAERFIGLPSVDEP